MSNALRLLIALTAAVWILMAPPARSAPKRLKVFILAGQSNMEGQAVADLDGKDCNDGKGTLTFLLAEPSRAERFRHLRGGDGHWAKRDDVWVRYRPERGELKAGPLGLGFTPYAGRHHFGPELQFGHIVGDRFPEQVLLIKTAWGGKSLYRDFRPPSSGGVVGPYYTKMLSEVREALANVRSDFPSYAGGGYELAGFVWYQGWNDGAAGRAAVAEYEQNLVNLIRDVRRDLKVPGLPVVVGELTGPWVQAPDEWGALRQAQAAAAARPEFHGNVRFVEMHRFVRKPADSPNPGHGHHEFGNAETCLLVGEALGKGMTALLGSQPAFTWRERTVEGWNVAISERLLADDAAATQRALDLLAAQLQEIVRVVPAPAVEKLRKVRLWFSPEYPGTGPRAEYHPGADWLREHGRDPNMVRGVEFTNVRIFPAEIRRMPNFVLHELAHAYHDQVLGTDRKDLLAAYERARASGTYDRVERQDAEGHKHFARAYALTNVQEYFAETTEAFFVRNDFYPYTRDELLKHDPAMAQLLAKVWRAPLEVALPRVTAPPAALRAPALYKKCFLANGYPILASAKVNDYALKEAGYLVNLMLARRPDVRQAMIQSGSRLSVMAYNEFTTELPGWQHLQPKDFWDARARGLGGSETDPLCSCAEENLLGYPGDPYAAENILIHEFAHNIHLRGMSRVAPGFDARVLAAHNTARKAGLWRGKYASVNHHEYFAEGVQSWFDNNRENDHDHNHVNTRAELLEYDPALAALCREVFGDTELKYTKPATRLRDHLAGYDPAAAPTFVWPARLERARAAIRRQAIERSQGTAPPRSP